MKRIAFFLIGVFAVLSQVQAQMGHFYFSISQSDLPVDLSIRSVRIIMAISGSVPNMD